MRRAYFFSPLLILLLLAGALLPVGPSAAPVAEATSYHTITIDGDLSDWDSDEYMETDAGYDLYLTWDATNIYLGLTNAFLGDDPGQDKSFFACFDTDLAPGSGAPGDGYGRVIFDTNLYAPEYCFYFAGGGGWYEWSWWDGASWQWPGWRNDGSYYNWLGNPAPFPGSELTIIRAEIGDPTTVGVVAWLTHEGDTTIEASWPTPNPVGVSPTFTHFYHLPMLIDGLSPNRSVLADHIIINELDCYTELLELYNPTDAAVDISNWHLTSDTDGLDYYIPGGTILAAGEYYTVTSSGDLDTGGEIVHLYDTSAVLIDEVGYGYLGGAPAPSFTWRTAARVPNGTDTDDHAWDWNLTQTPTFGSANIVPPVLLGSTVLFNEFDNYPSAGGDVIEFYNPTGQDVTITDWYVSDGDAVDQLTGAFVVPAGGWLTLTEDDPGSFTTDFSSYDVGYLLMPNGVRVEQIGWQGEFEDDTFQRVCDGDGPNDGYNWSSSGGGVTWFDFPDTLGSTNTPGPVDMTLYKTAPITVAPGGLITYVVTYGTLNPMPTTAFTVTDALPAEVAYSGYSADPPLSLVGTDPLVWDGGARCGYFSGTITITGQVTDTVVNGQVLTNVVWIEAAGDVDPGNDVYTATTIVEAGCLAPTADFASDSPVPLGLPMHFNAQVDGTAPFTYSWDFGGPGSGSGLDTPTPVYTYSITGTFTVHLTVTNACGEAYAVHDVEVLLFPPTFINEIRIDQPSSDDDEYFELAGPASASLDGLTYIVIGDGTGGSGVVEAVVDLTGTVIPGDGYFFAAEDNDTFGALADLTTTLNFENSDNVTHMLVRDFTGALNDDLDVDDDGVLDVTPWTVLEDCVALLEEVGGGELVYCPTTVGPDGSFVPAHTYWCEGGWIIGNYDPLDGGDTPGTENGCLTDVAIDKIGPLGITAGERITYTLDFYLNTVLPGSGIVITDALPANTSFFTFSSSIPVTWTGTDPLVFQVDPLAGLGSAFIDLVVDVDPGVLPGDQLVNVAAISCSRDYTLTNNAAVFTSTVVGSEVTIDKTGQPFAFPGDFIAYTVTYQIQGDPAENVVITDTLPDDAAYVSDTAPVAPTEPSPGTFVWSLGTVTETASFHLYVQVDPDPLTTTLHNQVWISALTDTLSENNYAYWDTILPTPIYDIQYTEDPGDGTYPSPYQGEYLYTCGVVVGVYPPTSGHVRFVLADPWTYGPWQGLYVYAEETVIPSVVEGQRLLLGGTVDEYFGLTEFFEPDVYYLLDDAWPLPDAVLTTTAVITTGSPATAEPLESVLLQVEGAEVTNEDLGFGEWGITDASGVEARVDDLGGYTYVPQLGDLLNVRGILWYAFGDYKLEPRYDPDIEQIYQLSLVYHDQEDVVGMDEAVYVAGEFNGWDPLANPLIPNGDASVFDTILTLDMTGTYEYKYVVYTDTAPSGPAQWDWLNTGNRQVIVGGSTEVDDYRAVDVGYAHLMEPAAITITLGDATGPITGEVFVQNVTNPPGEGRAIMAELGYGSDTDPASWDWGPLTFTGQQNGNNDIYSASFTPTAAGVYSYAVRFDGNWGLDNPNAGWTYGDLDGVYPGDPFEIENAGVLTVLEPPCVPVDIVAISTTVNGCVVDFAGDLTGDAPFTYLWTFGDGMTSTAAMPSHDYGASGTYSGTLEVWNCTDGYDIEPFVVTVSCEVEYTIYLPLVTKGYTP